MKHTFQPDLAKSFPTHFPAPFRFVISLKLFFQDISAVTLQKRFAGSHVNAGLPVFGNNKIQTK